MCWVQVAAAMLTLGRGAFGSKGRTSWTSKPEQSDYISVLGFMTYYMHHLCADADIPYTAPQYSQSEPELVSIPSESVPDFPLVSRSQTIQKAHDEEQQKPLLIIGGYSYGSMIVSALSPIINSLITSFQSPKPGSGHAEIRLRSKDLAKQQNILIQKTIAELRADSSQGEGHTLSFDSLMYPTKPRGSLGGMRTGGTEDLSRASSDSARSRHSLSLEAAPENLRQSMEKVKALASAKKERFSPRRHRKLNSVPNCKSESPPPTPPPTGPASNSSDSTGNSPTTKSPEVLSPIPGIVDQYQHAYLLVSPIQGFVKNLASMWSFSRNSNKDVLKDGVSETDVKFTIDPTLAIFGDDDTFVSIKKFRAWCKGLEMREEGAKVAGSEVGVAGRGKGEKNFTFIEVPNAGHFWMDDDAVNILQREVTAFAERL